MRPEQQQGKSKHGTFPSKEHQFKPGQSGNPGGRPKGSGVTGALRKLLEQLHNGKRIEELVAERWLKEVLSGKPTHLEMLLDRTEGKAKQTHELTVASSAEIIERTKVAAARAAKMSRQKPRWPSP